jgi:hypothetical protein
MRDAMTEEKDLIDIYDAAYQAAKEELARILAERAQTTENETEKAA